MKRALRCNKVKHKQRNTGRGVIENFVPMCPCCCFKIIDNLHQQVSSIVSIYLGYFILTGLTATSLDNVYLPLPSYINFVEYTFH
ncbi:uncharacterized protein DS421_6g173710 [Arachis hypogaea]|nr:uncharacterized protein DS421_6g173710 [Arachis hypogaea]